MPPRVHNTRIIFSLGKTTTIGYTLRIIKLTILIRQIKLFKMKISVKRLLGNGRVSLENEYNLNNTIVITDYSFIHSGVLLLK